VEMKFELVPVPVADINRAEDFYVDRLGFNVDVRPADGVRVVQLTPRERPARSSLAPACR
jgi:catechol 2,3-dioxygenase-like lactoylglutathione lyase family enzyme